MLLLATTAAVALTAGCGGNGDKSSTGTTASGTPAAHNPASSSKQRCVDRWNSNLKRTGAIKTKLTDITSYTAHVDTVHGLCVVIIMRSGQMLAFASRGPHRARTGSDYLLVPPNGRPLRPELRVPNARFNAQGTLELK